jgi:hypothetical protein
MVRAPPVVRGFTVFVRFHLQDPRAPRPTEDGLPKAVAVSVPQVALRQFVVTFTFPFELRLRLAYDGKLL